MPLSFSSRKGIEEGSLEEQKVSVQLRVGWGIETDLQICEAKFKEMLRTVFRAYLSQST